MIYNGFYILYIELVHPPKLKKKLQLKKGPKLPNENEKLLKITLGKSHPG